ncbi:hypothetical protein ACFV98_02495 [Streptomyces violascens]|uniref:hypothetical protein n=1 Tax=Streptomyces violascens TaxID=67381 RepID=UPI00365940CB
MGIRKRKRTLPVCSGVNNRRLGPTPCKSVAVVGEHCLRHTTDRQAARRYSTKQTIQDRVGCLVLLAIIAVGVKFAVPIVSDWAAKNTDQKCRPIVASYEEERGKAEPLQIPLILGASPTVADSGYTDQDIMGFYAAKRAQAGKAASIAVAHKECFTDEVVSRAQDIEALPKEALAVSMPSATTCADGWLSPSIGSQGACSYHGGVVNGSPYAVLFLGGRAPRSSLPPILHLFPAS